MENFNLQLDQLKDKFAHIAKNAKSDRYSPTIKDPGALEVEMSIQCLTPGWSRAIVSETTYLPTFDIPSELNVEDHRQLTEATRLALSKQPEFMQKFPQGPSSNQIARFEPVKWFLTQVKNLYHKEEVIHKYKLSIVNATAHPTLAVGYAWYTAKLNYEFARQTLLEAQRYAPLYCKEQLQLDLTMNTPVIPSLSSSLSSSSSTTTTRSPLTASLLLKKYKSPLLSTQLSKPTVAANTPSSSSLLLSTTLQIPPSSVSGSISLPVATLSIDDMNVGEDDMDSHTVKALPIFSLSSTRPKGTPPVGKKTEEKKISPSSSSSSSVSSIMGPPAPRTPLHNNNTKTTPSVEKKSFRRGFLRQSQQKMSTSLELFQAKQLNLFPQEY